MIIKVERVAVDIQDLGATKSGQKLEHALIANGAQVFMTARMRKALLIGIKNFTNLQKRMNFTVRDSYDGTVEVEPAPELTATVAEIAEAA